MTIFLDIAKHFLNLELNKEYIRLYSSTTSNIPDIKKKYLDILIKSVAQLKDKDSDEGTKRAIDSLIHDCQNAVEDECRTHNLDDAGTFGKSMEHTHILLDTLFRHFKNRKFLDIKPNPEPVVNSKLHYSDPLDIFNYYAAFYIAEKELKPESNFLIAFAKSCFYSTAKVSAEKEKHLFDSLHNCKTALNYIDDRKPDYPIAKAEHVLQSIQIVLYGNQATCSSHTTSKNIPINLAVKVPLTFGPAEGKLKDRMEEAQEEIEILIVTLKEQLKTTQVVSQEEERTLNLSQ
ncbi:MULTISPECIES: hypothetical protein [unclassified Legionella]|uniref:hypothetical protein n=1 Tax=unclassified Legionella TaxID=2622702 RepID=UPI001054AD6F|nr:MULTISPECIES: hypothetical protein [unclassified Legionella]MDI9819533.1 hypothetical protein [Legionella sp. PL877]